MQFGKMLLVGAAAFAMVLGTVGCATDDESVEMFKVKAGANGNGKGGFNGDNGNGFGNGNGNGNADLNSFNNGNGNGNGGFDSGNSGNAGNWGDNKGLSPYDDFGTPIAGLSFQPVYFKFDQSTIAPSEYSKLDQIVSYLTANPGTGVVIEGHCDSKGSDEYNRALGERRALSAKDYLLGKGIADSRIRTVSYGEEKPAASNDSDADRAKNRRDEFIGVTLKR